MWVKVDYSSEAKKESEAKYGRPMGYLYQKTLVE